MWHRYRHFGADDEASLHWRYKLPSPNPANPDARLLSCLSEKSLIPTFEIFHFNLPRTRQGFSTRDAWLYPELNDCYSRSRRQWMQRGGRIDRDDFGGTRSGL